MAGTNKFELAKKALNENVGKTIGAPALKAIIQKQLASDENTAAKYCTLMLDTGLIEEVAPFRFLILKQIKEGIKE